MQSEQYNQIGGPTLNGTTLRAYPRRNTATARCCSRVSPPGKGVVDPRDACEVSRPATAHPPSPIVPAGCSRRGNCSGDRLHGHRTPQCHRIREPPPGKGAGDHQYAHEVLRCTPFPRHRYRISALLCSIRIVGLINEAGPSIFKHTGREERKSSQARTGPRAGPTRA